MDWNSIVSDVVSGSVLLAVGAIGGWIIGLAKGKKKSSLAIERKNTIYQPLLDELVVYSDFKWDILTEVKVQHLKEIVNNHYKYGINDPLFSKCIDLANLIMEFTNIKPINIAHSIIVDLFKLGFEEMYGSVVDGVINRCDRDGNEWDEEVMVEPLLVIQQVDFSKNIVDLLSNEGMYGEEICIDSENDVYIPIYSQLKNMYASALNVRVNGEKYKLPNAVIDLDLSPEEYIALNYDFFQSFNSDQRIMNKYKLREEIVYQCQSVIQELKETIEKIVKVYEIEQI